jgi:serine/threonine protein kinase
MNAHSMPPAAGNAGTSNRTIAGYRLVAGIGKGGMARVYLALARKSGGFTKLLVLKVLRPELDEEGDFLAMFLQEAKIAARLNHPNVVQTYEVTEDAGRHLIAMEYLEGQAFSTMLTRVGRGKMPLPVYLRVLCDVLDGLHYAHDLVDYDGKPLRIVHRDISPQNVFVTYTGQAKLLDFGIAKVAGATRTQQGVLKGKVGYMAPEQAMGKPIDRRADIYAMGVLLWEGLSGRRFVERQEDEVAVLTRRITGSDPMIRVVAPEAQAELADICDRAMAPDPDKRYATAAEMRDALEAYLKKTEPADARRVAALLEEHFSEDRTRIRRLIEDQVKSADETEMMIHLETGATVTPPSLADVDALMTIATPAPTISQGHGFRRLAMGLGAVLVLGGVALGIAIFRHGADATASTSRTMVTTPSPSSSSSAPSSSSSSSPSSPLAQPTTSVTTPSAPAAPSVVTVSIRAVPSSAAILLDGKAVPNPHHVEMTKDGSTHTLQVTANGYATDKKALVFDHDHDLVVTLNAVQAGAVKPAATPATPDIDLTTVKPKRTKRTVDDKDPYK